MQIIFLGTGTSQGIPPIGCKHPVCLSQDARDKRLRSSIFVKVDNTHIQIDCGPDFRQQMLANSIEKIDGILFTHEHADHTAGLDDIRPYCFQQGKIAIYSNQRVLDQLRIRFSYIFNENPQYPGLPEVSPHFVDSSPFFIKETKIVPLKIDHGGLDILGFRIGSMAYITDAKDIEVLELEKLEDLKGLIINALRVEPHRTHFSLDEALLFSKKINAEKTYLTHISHLLGFHSEVNRLLPRGTFLAYDNLRLEL